MRTFAGGIALVGTLSLMSLIGCNGSSPTTSASPAESGNATGDLALGTHVNELPLAMSHLRIDGETGAVEVSPVRLNTAIGDAYIVGLNALRRNFEVTSITKQNGPGGQEVVVDCAFTHPFPNATRPDLMGWDLKAIVATDVDQRNINGVRVATDIVNNAAGYTNEWTPEITAAIPSIDATAFPYIILGEDRTVPTPFVASAPSGYNCFPPGSVKTGTLNFDVIPGETIDVDLFFTVGFQVAATRATRQTPDYQPPRGNMRAAWRVDAEVSTNTLSTGVGSFAIVDLEIWDWQHGQSLDSDVAGISVYAPELTATPITPTVGPESGRDLDPITASFSIANTLGTIATTPTYALIEVRDALDGANPGGNTPENGVDLIEDDFTTIRTPSEIRTYQVLELDVTLNLPGVDPVACVTSTPPLSGGTLTIPVNTNVQWDATCSTDADPGGPEGTIVGWEWDFEWDGIPANFTDDTAGVGTALESHTYATAPLTTHLGLRVEDGVGRKSAILDIPITVNNQMMTLTLSPIEDLNFPPNVAQEHGAAVVEESDGVMGVAYSGYTAGPGTINTYSSWNGSSWTSGTNNYSSSDGLEFGWYAKANPNWVTNDVVALTCWTSFGTHNGIGFAFGYRSPGFNLGYGVPLNYNYGTEVCTHRSDGRIFAFGDEFNQLFCWRGGPTSFDQPVFWWPGSGTVVPTPIDTRLSAVSRVRSSESAADGSIHIAYRAQDGSQLRYAKNTAGDNVSWTVTDLLSGSAGAFDDPAFSLDEGTGAHIAVAQNTAGTWQLQWISSSNMGTSWGTPVPVGATFAQKPTDISLSVRTISGYQVVAIGYTTSTHPALSEFRVRWTSDGGTIWHDDLISAGADAFSPDLMVTRSSGRLLGAWSASLAGRDNVFVRRGQFAVI